MVNKLKTKMVQPPLKHQAQEKRSNTSKTYWAKEA